LVFVTPSPTKLVGRSEHRRVKGGEIALEKGRFFVEVEERRNGRRFSMKKEIPFDRFVR
jgi:hypothetical protein